MFPGSGSSHFVLTMSTCTGNGKMSGALKQESSTSNVSVIPSNDSAVCSKTK